MSSKSRGKTGRHFGIAVGPTHSSRPGWTEMAALRADLHLLPPASSASPLRLFLAARHSASGDVAARGIDATFFFISRASQIDGEKRSDFNIGTSGNFYRKSRDGRSLTLSSRPPPFLSTLSLQPFRSLTTRPIPRPPFFFLLAVVQ